MPRSLDLQEAFIDFVSQADGISHGKMYKIAGNWLVKRQTFLSNPWQNCTFSLHRQEGSTKKLPARLFCFAHKARDGPGRKRGDWSRQQRKGMPRAIRSRVFISISASDTIPINNLEAGLGPIQVVL